MSTRALKALVSAAVLSSLAAACQMAPSADPPNKTPSEKAFVELSVIPGPRTCVSREAATGEDIQGTISWVRFCPGKEGHTVPAEIPSGKLLRHLDLLAGIEEADRSEAAECSGSVDRTYRLQIGYDDGQVTEISGRTNPGCLGTISATGAKVRGPDGLGVYGVVMAAFGQQHAERLTPTDTKAPMLCPADPRELDSVDEDGPSARLKTGYYLGRRVPMLMPLTAERGIVCTWQPGSGRPTKRDLSQEEAERVRIGMHSISNAMVDCDFSRSPTYTAVVEDKTGTRRAVTVIDSECSTVIRSDGSEGLGFAWLDR